eukprot:3827301-Rhodomonas_salina.2
MDTSPTLLALFGICSTSQVRRPYAVPAEIRADTVPAELGGPYTSQYECSLRQYQIARKAPFVSTRRRMAWDSSASLVLAHRRIALGHA